MKRAMNPARLLARILAADALGADVVFRVDGEKRGEWNSALFEGERIELNVRVTGERSSEWLSGLPDVDLRLPGWFVAELVAEPTGDGSARLDALLLREC